MPSRACDIIREAERYGAPEGSKRPRIYSNYVALMCNIVDEELTCFEDVEEEPIPEDHDMEEPQGPMDTSREMI